MCVQAPSLKTGRKENAGDLKDTNYFTKNVTGGMYYVMICTGK